MRLRAGVVVLLFCVLAPRASAATLKCSAHDNADDDAVGKITFIAAPGETNTVTVSATKHAETIIRDSTNPLHFKGNARAIDTHSGICAATFDTGQPTVKLGDGNDRAIGAGNANNLRILGGPGNDKITITDKVGVEALGGPGNDTLTGGPGSDVLTGGVGNDRVLGLGGPDVFVDETDATAAADVYDGGAGNDSVSYSFRTAAVTVDLEDQTTDTGDTITGLEGVTGGAGADVLTGSAARNTLIGKGGDDLLNGGDERDHLEGGKGADTLMGGAGDDSVNGETGDDAVNGDDGNDEVRGEDGGDRMAGGAGDDTIDAGYDDGSVDTVEGDAGDDRINSADSKAKSKDHGDGIDCGDGADSIEADDNDLVTGCETLDNGSVSAMTTQPAFAGGTATFMFAANVSSSDTLTLHGPDGEDFGTGTGNGKTVAVTLTPAAVTALQAGTIVHVTFEYGAAVDNYGYATQMEAP